MKSMACHSSDLLRKLRVKEPEQIESWLESMKKGARYIVKDRQDDEPESFESLEAARRFLLQHRKDKVVGSGESVRFAGRDIERLPKSDIRRSVEIYIEKQKVFPLESANNIRGRLRRHKFAVYKKGSKGVSFVCAVKRKFRDSKTVFTDSIRELIEFIEKHPETPASKLPKAYIGIDTEKQKPETLKMTEAEVEAAAKAKAAAPATGSNATQMPSAPSAEAKTESSAETPSEKPAESETAADEAATGADEVSSTIEVSEAVPKQPAEAPEAAVPEPKSAIAEDAKASTEAKPKVELTEAESKKLRQLMGDLRWLITEGYVTEYGDGRLFAPPPMPEAKPKPAEPAKAKAATSPVEPTKTEEAAVEDDAKGAEYGKESDLPKASESPESSAAPEATESSESEETSEEPAREGKDPA